MLRALSLIFAVTCGLAADNDAETALLARVRQHVAASVAGLPNYTCRENMDRAVYAPTGKVEFRERLRLEVLFTETSEQFAWPGSTAFRAKPLESWIRSGAIADGSFVTNLHNLFLRSGASLKYAGEDKRDERALYQFDFHAALLSSKYHLTIQGQTATTAYSGSFWVTKDSLDLARLEVRAEDIPPYLDCRVAQEIVTYGRVRLGVNEQLIPAAAELSIVGLDGHEDRNTIAFSNCRHYTAGTSISFTAPPASVPQVEAAAPEPKLPAKVALALRLEQPISLNEAAAGDPIVARLDKAVNSGAMALPKGSRVFGRIGRLEQHLNSPAWVLVGLEFFAAESAKGRVAFSARLTGPQGHDEVRLLGDRYEIVPRFGLDIEDDGATTGVGRFRVSGKEISLPRGFRTFWETR